MLKPAPPTQTAAVFMLRIYGLACLAWGLVGLAVTIQPGTNRVVDLTRLWQEFALCVLLGTSVFLLLRWLVLAFSLLSAGVGIFCIGWSMMLVPFPAGLFNLLFAILLIIPVFLTSHAWPCLR